jgi:hypothetical protein
MRYEGTGTGARLFKARTELLYHSRAIGQRFLFAEGDAWKVQMQTWNITPTPPCRDEVHLNQNASAAILVRSGLPVSGKRFLLTPNRARHTPVQNKDLKKMLLDSIRQNFGKQS